MTQALTTTIEPEVVRDTIQAPYRFNDTEKLELGERLVQSLRDTEQIEREFESVKEEFKARTKKAELETNTIRGKLGNGFEMRATVAIVRFNTPTAGRKQFVNEETGEEIREEAMSPADYDRPLFRNPNGQDATVPEPVEPASESVPSDAGLSSPGAVDAGITPVGEALDRATAATDQPKLPIPLDQAGWTVGGLRTELRVQAVKAKWPESAIALAEGVIDGCGGDLQKVKASLRNHVLPVVEE